MLIKRFFNDNATGQPKEEGSNATLNPAPSSIFKWWASEGFLVSVPLLRQLMLTALFFVIQGLCFLANQGRGTSESGTRRDRIWEEVRSRLGQDTTASGTVFANKYRIWFIGVVAPCFTRCCYVACAMWWIYIDVALAFGIEMHPLKTSKASMIFYCV